MHWQNLNRGKDDRAQGSGVWSGRAWFGSDEVLHIEWHFGGRAHFTHLYLRIGGEGERVGVAFALPHLCSLYATWEGMQFKRQHEYGIAFHDGCVSISLGTDEWHEKPSHLFWDWRSFLKGGCTTGKRIIEERPVVICLEEGAYQGTATLFDTTWRYPRWFPHTVRRVTIEIPKGLPIPGKGESGHDLDDDAIFSQTAPARSIDEAEWNLRETVLRRRRKYNWSKA